MPWMYLTIGGFLLFLSWAQYGALCEAARIVDVEPRRWQYLVFAVANALFVGTAGAAGWPSVLISSGCTVLLVVEAMVVIRREPLVLAWRMVSCNLLVICMTGVIVAWTAVLHHWSLWQARTNLRVYLFAVMAAAAVTVALRLNAWRSGAMQYVQPLIGCRSQLRLVVVVQAILFGYQIFCTFSYSLRIDYTWFALFHLAGCVLCLLGYYAVLHQASQFSVWLSSELKIELLQAQLERQINHYRSYQSFVEEFRTFRAEYNRTVGTLRNMIQQDDRTAALELLGRVNQQVYRAVEQRQQQYSNNMLVDSIMQDLAASCREKGITWELHVFLPAWLCLTDLELCRIFTNICTNALEACVRLPEGMPRSIGVSARASGDWLTVTASNTFSGKLRMRNGQLLTTKSNAQLHGMGLRSVQQIVECHGGFLNIEEERGEAAQEPAVFKLSLHFTRVSMCEAL